MRASFLAFLKSDAGLTLFIALGWQISLTILGWWLAPQQGLLGHMSHWDAGWYKHIIEYAYSGQGSPAAPAFYPLFPFAIWLIHTLSFGLIGLNESALLLNTGALWLVLLALVRILLKFNIPRIAQHISILAFLAFPSAFFLHVFYSEALFIALGLWAYLFALNKKWWAAGLLLGILTACRLPSLLFVALCGLEFLRAHHWSIKKSLNPQLLWFLCASLGLIVYGCYLFVTRGDFLAMFHAYSATDDWTYQVLNPNILETLSQTTVKIAHSLLPFHPTYDIFVNYALPLLCIIAILGSSIYLLKNLKSYGIPLFIFGILSIILFTLNSNVVSVHRYTLACVPIFIAAALLAQRKRWRYSLVVISIGSIVVQVFLYAKFIHDIFAG